MRKFVMVHDENLCIGCQACVVACKNTHHVPDGVSKLAVYGEMSGTFPKLKLDLKRHSCAMCEESPCVDVCPTGASFRTEDGVVLIDKKSCIGCKYCILACPYDARYVEPETGKVSKCTFCYKGTSKGGMPSCVRVCPTDALIFGDANDASSPVAKALAKAELQRAELGLKPRLASIKNTKGGK